MRFAPEDETYDDDDEKEEEALDITKDDYSDEDIFKDEGSPKDNQILGDLLDAKLTGAAAQSGAPSPGGGALSGS